MNIHKESKPTCCTILLLIFVRSTVCFGQIDWLSSGIQIQRCFN